ncbi:hypothetical protein M9458_001335, partial [Cirrhinus mrigala]
MEVATHFSALAGRDLPFVEYAWEFCGLATMSVLDNTTLNSLFWIGANYNRPVVLPDTTGLSWREGILRCLESVRPQFRTSPPAALHSSPMASLFNVVDIMDMALPPEFSAPILSPSSPTSPLVPSSPPESPMSPLVPSNPPVPAPPERPPGPAPPELSWACSTLISPKKILPKLPASPWLPELPDPPWRPS